MQHLWALYEGVQDKATGRRVAGTVHHATAELEGDLLVAQVCNVMQTVSPGVQHVFLNQECVLATVCGEGVWVLDTGATNHMTGCRATLVTLDETV